MIELRDTTDHVGAMQHLQRAAAYSTDGATVEAMAKGCHVLDIVKHGRTVGALAVEIVGHCATIKAAASEGDFVGEEWPLIEDALKGHGVKHVAFFTKRPGLIRAMQRAGFAVRSCEMEKVIQ